MCAANRSTRNSPPRILAEAREHIYLSRRFPGKDKTAMLDAAVKALSQILSPPMRSILWRSIALALVLIVVLALGLQRLLSWLSVYGEDCAEAMLGPGFHTPLTRLAVRAGHVGRRQARAADDPGLSDRAALRVPGRSGFHRFLHRNRLAVGTGIFQARGDAVSLAGGSQGDAQAQCRHRVHRWAGDRSVRLDPDRQPGDAALRHGVHGPHAQAAFRST